MTQPAKPARMRWRDGLLIIDMTIVGVVEHSSNGSWYSFGCLEDWQDIDLGSYAREIDAKRIVEDLAKEQLEAEAK